MNTEAQHFINLLSPYIHSYGYLVAFFGMMLENAGIPVPAETALIVLAFFAGQGVLKVWLVIPIAILGDATGDNIGFWIGRLGGRRLVEKYGRYVRIDKAKLDAMEALFKEKGGRTVFSAHFFSTTRITAALIAGISHMEYRRFLAYNLAAASVFVTLVASATFYFGKNLDATLRFFHLFRLAGLTVAVLLVTVYLYRFYQRKKHLYKRLGLKIIAIAIAVSVLLWLLVYAVSGALIVLPRTGKNAGLTHGSIKGTNFTVEHGFISDLGSNSLLITALGRPTIKFSNIKQPAFITITIRNIKANDTAVQGSSLSRKPFAIDDLTLGLGVSLTPAKETDIVLKPKAATNRFSFSVTGDTRDAGPIFDQLISSVNTANPSFLLHAGDLVKDGEKRRYRDFLDQVGALKVPLYTDIGSHELIDRGEPIYLQLFGPKNYDFNYQNSTFIILDTAKQSIKDVDFSWLAGELQKAEGSQNIFVITYTAPSESARFTSLMARFHVKTVYSVKTMGVYYPLQKGVRYELLGHQPEARYFYKLVKVNGNTITEQNVKIEPKGLSITDKIILAYEELKREIVNFF